LAPGIYGSVKPKNGLEGVGRLASVAGDPELFPRRLA
jgi:hypothetical protein